MSSPRDSSLSGSVSTLRSEYMPLWEALQEENFDSFKQQFDALSREAQIEIVQANHEGRNFLHVACSKTSLDVVATLLRTMGEPEIEDEQRKALLWLQDRDKRWTPLHYACKQQREDIVKQLLDPPWTRDNNRQSIPITATTTLLEADPSPDIMRLLLRYCRGNPLHIFSDFNFRYPDCQLPRGSVQLEHVVPIVVVGDKNSGKSTIIKSLQIEGAARRFTYLFRNVSGTAQHKGGVIPTQVYHHSYMGRVVFFELSGNREFVHESVLDSGHLADAVFIVVIDTREDIPIMTQRMVYWTNFICYYAQTQGIPSQPNIIITGSHRDILPFGRLLAPNERFLHAYNKARPAFHNCNLLSYYTMDFRRATLQVLQIQFKLYNVLQRLRQHRPALPSICYVLYSIIDMLCEEKKDRAITIYELSRELTNTSPDHYPLLTQDPGELLEYCERLKELNILRILEDSDHIENSWIITDPLPLLEEIEEAFFANEPEPIPAYPPQEEEEEQPAHQNIATSRLSLVLSQHSSGIMERSELEARFRTTTNSSDIGLLIKVMEHFKYTVEIGLPQTPPKPDRLCFYIPHLLPQELTYERWNIPDPDYTYICTWAMIPKNFLYFMPHLTLKLLLRISLSADIVPLHCSRSQRSLAWVDPSIGVQVLISDYYSEAFVLNIRCFKGNEIECLRLRSAIISKIRSLIVELDSEFTVREIMIPRSRVESTKFRHRLPILNPLHSTLWHCNMDDIKAEVSKGDEYVATNDPANLVKITDLLYFEPYSKMHKMPAELLALLKDPVSNDMLTEPFILELLTALGNGVVDQNALQLFLRIVGIEIKTQLPNEPIAIAAVATYLGLTYSQLRTHLDSICIIKYNDL